MVQGGEEFRELHRAGDRFAGKLVGGTDDLSVVE